jgi:hypothetical protein
VFKTAEEMIAKRPPKYVFFEATYFIKGSSADGWQTGLLGVMIMLHQVGWVVW